MNQAQMEQKAPEPSAALRKLVNLIGTWKVSGGAQGRVTYYKGKFSDDGNTLSGEWTYPGGGGYESTAIRVKEG